MTYIDKRIKERFNCGIFNEVLPFKNSHELLSGDGTIWAYRLGRDDSPKVILIHGINTSCHSPGYIAQGLSNKYDINTYVSRTSFGLYGKC